MKKKLSEAINLQSFITAYDHILQAGWTVDEVRQVITARLQSARQQLEMDPGKDKCPVCQEPLVVKVEISEVVTFCSVCDYEGK